MSDRRPPCRGAWAAAAVLSVAAAASGAQQPARPAHAISYVTLSPDGRFVASVEGENAPRGGDPVVRELVIRRADGGSRGGGISVVLPCARLRGCWPSYPAWTPDSRRLTFVLRDPDTHARSLYQVNPDGT